MRGAQARADGGGRAEVEGRALHGRDARGDQRGVDRVEAARGHREPVVQRAAVAGKVEVVVVAEVDHRRAIGGGLVVDPPGAAGAQRVGDECLDPARKAFLAVLAHVAQRDGRTAERRVVLARRCDLPQPLAEALDAAVQRVVAVVARERVRLAGYDQLAARDAIGVAADDDAEVRVAVDVVVEVVEASHHVGGDAVAIGHRQRGDEAAQRDQAQHEAAVGQRHLLDEAPVGQVAIGASLQRGG